MNKRNYYTKGCVKGCIKQSARRLIVGLSALLPLSGFALSIGNFIPTSSSSAYLEITDFNKATYLDVLVEIDGKPVNYLLEQVSDDQVLVKIYDNLLDKTESLIEVSVNSEIDSRTRSFAYRNEAAISKISDNNQARKSYSATLKPALKQLIVPSVAQVDDDSGAGEFKNGMLHINITRGQTSVGTAVEHLARANNLNVLILPGDRYVHDSLLVGPVTQFADLYFASNQLVKHVYIDRARKMVRIVGAEQISDESAINLKGTETEPDKTTNIGQLLKDIAMVNGYTALIYPGDAEALLNTPVSWEGVQGIDDLAMLVGQSGGRLDIDRTNRLLRARKLK